MPTKNKPEVSLIDEDGNAFAIIGKCVKAARRAGWSAEEIETLRSDMMSGDYDHLLAVAQERFEVT
jgi:hypothetical protein